MPHAFIYLITIFCIPHNNAFYTRCLTISVKYFCGQLFCLQSQIPVLILKLSSLLTLVTLLSSLRYAADFSIVWDRGKAPTADYSTLLSIRLLGASTSFKQVVLLLLLTPRFHIFSQEPNLECPSQTGQGYTLLYFYYQRNGS